MKIKKAPDSDNVLPSAFYLVYGASGTRKSTLCGTLGELGKVLVVDSDEGYQTYFRCPYIKEDWKANTSFVDFGEFLDFHGLYTMLAKSEYKKFDLEKPDWVVLDTYTAMEPALMRQIAQTNGIKGSKDLKDFQDKFGFTEWGMLKEYHLKYLRAMKALVSELGINIVYVMQETLDKDELSGSIIGGPKTTGKAWIDFPEAFDVVIHTTTSLQGDSVVSTLSKGKFPAKNRLVGIGEELKTQGSKQIITFKEVMHIN